jgi:hypothetical protein
MAIRKSLVRRVEMRRILVLAAMILLSVFVLAARHAHAAELHDLRDLNELRAMVDHDKAVMRVVLLLSPT